MKFIDEDLDLAALRGHAAQLCTILLGRNVELESRDVNGANVHGRTQQAQDTGAKAEFVHPNQWLDPLAVDIRVRLPVNHQSFARNHQTLRDRHLEFGEIDTTVETGGKGFNNTRA